MLKPEQWSLLHKVVGIAEANRMAWPENRVAL
jgi:hypothetical protein